MQSYSMTLLQPLQIAEYEFSKKCPFLFKLPALRQHGCESYDSSSPEAVRLNRNYDAYNEYRPADEYMSSTMTRQQSSPFHYPPRGIWRHTSHVSNFRPRESNSLKRRRSRSHLDDVFLANRDEDEGCNYSRTEGHRRRYADARRNSHRIPRRENRKANSAGDTKGVNRFCDIRNKKETDDAATKTLVRNATNNYKQSTVHNNETSYKGSMLPDNNANTGKDVQPIKKSDESAISRDDTSNNDIVANILTTKSYLTDHCFDNSSSRPSNPSLSTVDMEISSQDSTPKRRKIDECYVDRKKEQKITEGVIQAESSEDKHKNVANRKESKEPQNIVEKHVKKSEVEKVSKTDGNRQSTVCNQRYESERKILEGDNKVDMLYKRTESKEGLSYRIAPGYTIPKKTQSSRKNGFSNIDDVYSAEVRNLFGDVTDTADIKMSGRYKGISLKSTDDLRRKRYEMKRSSNFYDKSKPQNTPVSGNSRLHPDTSTTHSNNRLCNQTKPCYTSKPKNITNRVGAGSKTNDSQRSFCFDRSRSPIEFSSSETKVSLNIPNSENAVPKKICYRRYSDNIQSLDKSKFENSRWPLSSFRSPIDNSDSSDSNSKSMSYSKTNANSKKWNLSRNTDHIISSPDSPGLVARRRESTDVTSSNTQSPDTLKLVQNISGSENVSRTSSVVKLDSPSNTRTLFKSLNHIRPDLGAPRDNGCPRSYGDSKSDVNSKAENYTCGHFDSKLPVSSKAKLSITTPQIQCNIKGMEEGNNKSTRTTGIIFDNRSVSLSDNSRDVEYDSSSQDNSSNDLSTKNPETTSANHSGSHTSQYESSDFSRDSSHNKDVSVSKDISGSSIKSSDSGSTNIKQIAYEDKEISKIESVGTKTNFVNSKVERPKFKQKIMSSKRTTTTVRKKEKREKLTSATSMSDDSKKKSSSEVETPTKANKGTFEEMQSKNKLNVSNSSELLFKDEMSNTPKLIVIIEKEFSRKLCKPDETSSTTSNTSGLSNLFDDSKLESVSAPCYLKQISSDKGNPNNGIRVDSSSADLSSALHTVCGNGELVDIDSGNSHIKESKHIKERTQNHLHDELISSGTMNLKNDIVYSVCENDVADESSTELATQNFLGNDVRLVVDPVEEAVKSVINGKVVSEEVFASLRKITTSNINDELQGSADEYEDTIIHFNKDRNENTSACRDGCTISSMKGKSEISVKNIEKSVDGNSTSLIESKAKHNNSTTIEIPVDIKSYEVSLISDAMYNEENIEIIKELIDGKDVVLVPASEVSIQVVDSTICTPKVSTVNLHKTLSIKLHDVSFTDFEAGICSSLPSLQFELDSADTFLVESHYHGKVTSLMAVEIIEGSSTVFVNKLIDKKEQQDIPIIDLVDDKSDIPIIDLTEDIKVKKENQQKYANDIYEILVEATSSNEQITLYRSDETVNDNLDVQATSVSISALIDRGYELKQESEIEGEMKKELDEEYDDEPDSIFTEIELLNISKQNLRTAEVKMEVDQQVAAEVFYIKDELDHSKRENYEKDDTREHSSGSAQKLPTEASDEEKETQGSLNQTIDLSIQNVLPTENLAPTNKSMCADKHSSHTIRVQVSNVLDMPEFNYQKLDISDRSNKYCVAGTASKVAEDSLDKTIQGKDVELESVQDEIVDALNEIDPMIEMEDGSQARSEILTSQPNTSFKTPVKEYGSSAEQSLGIPAPISRATILQNEVLCPPVVSQSTIAPQTLSESSKRVGIDNSLQRNIPRKNGEKYLIKNPSGKSNMDNISQLNILRPIPAERLNVDHRVRKDGGTGTQPPNIIQTQNSLQQQDIWNVTGVLMKYLIRMHCLKACCVNYNKTLELYRLIDPYLYRLESKLMPQIHEKRLSIYAAEMKDSFNEYSFSLLLIPEDVLKVTYNRVKKAIPQLDMKWIIFVLESLMKEESKYYNTHASLKYLYMYITSASQQLIALKRQQDQLSQHKQIQYLGPDQLCALKNQIQQFNNICSTQQQLLKAKPQKSKKNQSSNYENPKASTKNVNSKIHFPPISAQITSSNLQDPKVSTKPASAFNPKSLAHLLQATPAASSSAQSSRVTPGTMCLLTHAMLPHNSSPNMSLKHSLTPIIRLKDPSSLMQDIPETRQTTSILSKLEHMSAKFPCYNASNSSRQNTSAENLTSLGNTPRSFNTMSSPMHQASDLTSSIKECSSQRHHYAPVLKLPPPAYISPNHSTIPSQNVHSIVQASSARQHGIISSAAQRLPNVARSIQTTIASSGCCYTSPRYQISPGMMKSGNISKTFRLPLPYKSSNHNTSQSLPRSPTREYRVMSSPTYQFPNQARTIENTNTSKSSTSLSSYTSPAQTSSADGIPDKTDSIIRKGNTHMLLPNISSAQSGVPNQILHSLDMSPAHNYSKSSPAHGMFVTSGQSRFNRNRQSVAMSPVHISAIHSPDQQTSDRVEPSMYAPTLSQNMSPIHVTLDKNIDSLAVSPARRSECQSVQTGTVQITNSPLHTARMPHLSSNKIPQSEPIAQSLTHQFGTNQTSGRIVCIESGLLCSSVRAPEISPTQGAPLARICSEMSSENNIQIETDASLTMHMDDDDGPSRTLVYAPMPFPPMYDQLSTSASTTPVSHISDAVEVIDLTWIDHLDEERLEMEVEEMVKKEELESDEEVIINNIEHFAVINDSQKCPPEF